MVPVLSIGPFTVATHDAFSLLALGVGLVIYYVELRRRGWLEPRIVWISIAAILGGALGARLITAWEHLEVYAAFDDVPLTWAIEHSGKSLIGALAGGYLATVLAKRAFGYTRSTGDAYLLAIPVAVVIGRIGCYFSELPLGTPTDLPWGVTSRPRRPRPLPGAPAASCRCTPRCSTRSRSTWSRSSSSSGSGIGTGTRPLPVVSFTFGLPPAAAVRRLAAAGSEIWVTVTSPAEAVAAVELGADALVVQGVEAGGHRGLHVDDDGGDGDLTLLAALQLIGASVDVPLVAAGRAGHRRRRSRPSSAAGAAAAQLGTAYLRCPEAGTSDVQRAATAPPRRRC